MLCPSEVKKKVTLVRNHYPNIHVYRKMTRLQWLLILRGVTCFQFATVSVSLQVSAARANPTLIMLLLAIFLLI